MFFDRTFQNSSSGKLRRPPEHTDRVLSQLHLERLEDRLAPAILSFQDGIFGYDGTQDAHLRFFDSLSNFGDTSNVVVDGDFDEYHAVMRFDDLFGPAANQIPLGSTITSATLTLAPISTGNVLMHRMLGDWGTEDTVTWSNLELNGNFDNGIQFAETSDLFGGFFGGDAREAYLARRIMLPAGSARIDVTNDLQLWSDGVPNHGWGFTADGIGSSAQWNSSEATQVASRPSLRIEFERPVENAMVLRLQEGVDNGFGVYTGTQDTELDEEFPDTNLDTKVVGFTSGAIAEVTLEPDFLMTTTFEHQALLRFDNLIGNGPGQIPNGSIIHRATLGLTTDWNRSTEEFFAYPMLVDWDASTITWTSAGLVGNNTPGFQPDDADASSFGVPLGVTNPNLGGATGNSLTDISAIVQHWASIENLGLLIAPGAMHGGDTLAFRQSEFEADFFFDPENIGPSYRPQLTIHYTPPGDSPLVFSEIMYNPNSPEDDWEWIELYNPGTTTINLNGWVLDDNDPNPLTTHNLQSGSVRAGRSAILYNADKVTAADFVAAWGSGLNLIPVTNWPTLDNDGDRLGLWSSLATYNSQDFGNALLDVTYDNTGDWPADDDASSIFLRDPTADPNDPFSWILSVSGAGGAKGSLQAGTNTGNDLGSPGVVFLALDDLGNVNEESPGVRITVTRNDVNTTGSTLEIDRLNGTAVIPDDVVTLPSGAKVTLNPDTSLLYNPNGQFDHLAPGEIFIDSFTYTIGSFGTSKVSTGTVTVTVLGQNDQPQIADVELPAIDEHLGFGEAVGTVIGTDADNGQVVSYAILDGNDSGAFAIDSATGEITINDSSAVDFEVSQTFILTVEARDNNTPTPASQTAQVTIPLNDINDAPVIHGGNPIPPVQIDENLENGVFVVNVPVVDQDQDPLMVSFSSGNESGAFSINSNGDITVENSSALDFESNPSFMLEIEVKDNGTPPLSDVAIITINLADLNDRPVIAGGDRSMDLLENTANGTTVITVLASDPDQDSFTFNFVGGNKGNAFALNPVTGEITVADSSQLDFEGIGTFELVVGVTDDGSPRLSSTVTINITLLDDNDPPIVADQTFTIEENLGDDEVVGTIMATDPEGQPLTYQITGGTGFGAFTINPLPEGTGELVVSDSTALDFESTPTLTLDISVSDGVVGSPVATATLTIELTDVLPLVTVEATDPQASESGDEGTFVLRRSRDVSEPLTVFYQVGGTAQNGVDYNMLSGSAQFSADQAEVTIPVVPLRDTLAEGTEAVQLALDRGPGYQVGPPISNQISITNVVPSATPTPVPGPGGTPGTPGTPATPGTPGVPPFNENLVLNYYVRLLNRLPSEEELNFLVSQLDGGIIPSNIVAQIQSTDEYLQGLVEQAYQTWLGRSVDSLGAQVWSAFLRLPGFRFQDLEVQLIISGEFAFRAATMGTDPLGLMYILGLGRAVETQGRVFWGTQIFFGVSVEQVARQILNSNERWRVLLDGVPVGQSTTDAGVYDRWLNRDSDPLGGQFFVTVLQGGSSIVDVIRLLASSEEFLRGVRTL